MRNSFLNILSILIFTLLPSVADAQSVTIRGKVMDEKRSPVELAHVRVEGMAAGATCDLKGKYQFTCESKDTMVVSFSMLGYETKKRTLYNPTDTVTINIMLNPAGIELGGVEVSTVRRQTNAMTDVNIKDMKHMGNASGGGVEQIIATQAGVSTHNELSSQYNVRGGSFDENSVYINGIEVYRPLLIRSGQQEGLSIINPDMIDKVSFSAGGFDARYGEKMSSVLDITYKKAKGFEG
ncbi:MAG: carboxypeptidase-like regulatory domain-containing protein, partial [Bacteroidaceae bacterium]|nr:carboxypeptidase-like regulatory domain-containing protein [Bacteroidaceae bacterium]